MKFSLEKHGSLLLFSIVILGLGLRICHLGFLSLWGDEAFTRFYSESPLSYLWTTGFRLETNPPLYYTVMHFWIRLFGTSEIALRSLSVIASLLIIVLVYAIGRELQNRTVGLIGALLLALAPTEIWYAQEARTFALLQVAVGLALLGMARYLSKAKPLGSLTIYAGGAVAAVYCHDTAFIFVVACNLAVFGVALLDSSFITRRDLACWLAANGVVALAILPLVITMWNQIGSDNIKWIPPLTSFSAFLERVREAVGGPAAHREFPRMHAFPYLTLLTLVCFFHGLRKLDRRAMAILVLTPFLFVVLTVLISFHRPILLPRVLDWAWIPVSLLLAQVLVHGARMRLPMLALIVLVFMPGLYAQYFPLYLPKENWPALLQKNHEQIAKADIIVFSTSYPVSCLIYYVPSAVPRLAYWREMIPSSPPGFSRKYFCGKFKIPTIETKVLLNEIASGKHVCLFVDRRDSGDITCPSIALLPPPNYRFDEVFRGIYGLHVFAWN